MLKNAIMKENVLSTRIDDKLYAELKEYKETYNISKSKILRNALNFFLRFAHKDKFTLAPYILFTKKEFAYLVNKLDDNELKEVANMSFKTAEKLMDFYIKKIFDVENEEFVEVKPRNLMSTLNLFIFHHYGQNWVSNVRQYFHKDKYYFSGDHSFNLNFSIYLKYFLEQFLELYQYSLIKEDLLEKKIILIFRKS